jgi:hypothetical protein
MAELGRPETKTTNLEKDIKIEPEPAQEYYFRNLCAQTRIKTNDGVICRVFSAFCKHPRDVPADDWRQMDMEQGTPLMIDVRSYEEVAKGASWIFDDDATVLGIYIGPRKE